MRDGKLEKWASSCLTLEDLVCSFFIPTLMHQSGCPPVLWQLISHYTAVALWHGSNPHFDSLPRLHLNLSPSNSVRITDQM